jgi:hypothetical protein
MAQSRKPFLANVGGTTQSAHYSESQTINQQGLIETTYYACRVVGPANILTGWRSYFRRSISAAHRTHGMTDVGT